MAAVLTTDEELEYPAESGDGSGELEPGAPTSPELKVQLCLLEGFELFVEGRPVEVVLSAQRLLAFVALQERPVLRAYAAGSLWMDKSEERAAANVRTALWRLRRPGLRLIEGSTNHLRLAANVTVDVRMAVRRARELLDPRTTADDGEFDCLLCSDILPDWYDEWVVVERERLRQLRLHALESLCVRMTNAGRAGEAIDVALAAVAAEPLRESAHRVLIQAHLSEGNRAEALRQFEAYRVLLWEELAVAPSPQLQELIAAELLDPILGDVARDARKTLARRAGSHDTDRGRQPEEEIAR